MKRFIAVLFFLGVMVALAGTAARAEGTIQWEGHGSENTPCADGGHWVLAPAFGIESATLTVDGSSYTMTQNGQGSWSADSVGPITSSSVAFVSYTGPGDERDHLQLSHCTEGSPTPTTTPPTTPPPTHSTPPPTHTNKPPRPGHHPRPTQGGGRLPETGANIGGLIALAALLTLGGASLYLARRRAA